MPDAHTLALPELPRLESGRWTAEQKRIVTLMLARTAAPPLLARIAALELELAGLRVDAGRLDWLEAWHDLPHHQTGIVMPGDYYGDTGMALIARTSDGWMLDAALDPAPVEFDSLREAIDAAIAAAADGTGGKT